MVDLAPEELKGFRKSLRLTHVALSIHTGVSTFRIGSFERGLLNLSVEEIESILKYIRKRAAILGDGGSK